MKKMKTIPFDLAMAKLKRKLLPINLATQPFLAPISCQNMHGNTREI